MDNENFEKMVALVEDTNKKCLQVLADHRHSVKLICSLQTEINSLRFDLDRARRRICYFESESQSQDARNNGMADWQYSPRDIAKQNGWNCFNTLDE